MTKGRLLTTANPWIDTDETIERAFHEQGIYSISVRDYKRMCRRLEEEYREWIIAEAEANGETVNEDTLNLDCDFWLHSWTE